MADLLKDIYHEAFLRQFAMKVQGAYEAFDHNAFLAAVMSEGWDELKLKERIRKIALTLGLYLPNQFPKALDVLFAIEDSCVGFPYLFFPDYVEVYGQKEEDWSLSMMALKRFTAKSSAEFAVRSFLLREPERMMGQMMEWAKSSNEHVRRLASEGCRPRLPWGQALPLFKRDPSPIMPILDLLKADPSLYVRKSVANNLNDIAKDHPILVLETAERWKGVDPQTDWIIRHGCRTLIRAASPKALALFGYSQNEMDEPLVTSAALTVNRSSITLGDDCELTYELQIREGEPQKIRVEYGIYFVKAGGRISRKLFLLSDRTVAGYAKLSSTRTHHWKDLSTRRHYPGEHRISLLVNGNEVASTFVQLQEP